MKEFDINSLTEAEVEAEAGQGKAVEILTQIKDFWDNLPEDDKKKVVNKLCEYGKTIKDSEAVQKLLELGPIKETLKSEGLTEEDKDTLARKLNIDRQILDGVDNALSLISATCKALPISVGKLWDMLELGPLDEIILAAADGPLPIGDFIAVLQIILSVIPDKVIIGALATVVVGGAEIIIRILKDVLIYHIIPEPAETKELQNALSESVKLTESFASQFKLYEKLWD